MLILIAIATFFSTLLGGLFALRLKDRLHLVLGFSAGAIIGVAFFDLLPEAIEISSKTYSVSFITTIIAIGFVTYLLLDRLVFTHSHSDDDEDHTDHAHSQRGNFGAGSLSIHSFLDGVGIGLAFQVSPTLGAVVAVAVLTHDFSDGINTVSMVIRSGGSRAKAFGWLLVDALAPIVGIFSTMFFTIKEEHLGLLLALFAGFFLYIGASDLLPESHHKHPVIWTTFATVLGVAVLYGAVRLAGV